MIGISILAAALALFAGLIVKLIILPRFAGRDSTISWWEFGVVAILMVGAVIPATSAAGSALSVADQLTRYQWVNGTEESANDYVRTCEVPDPSTFASMNNSSSGDTNCDYYYDSGLKFKYEEEECSTDTDGKETCDDVTYKRPIYYPYATVEHHYSIDSSMGKAPDGRMTYKFRGAYLDAKPVTPRGTPSVHIPDYIPKGAPADWLDAKARLDAGDARSAEKLVRYEDPILAASDTLREYSSSVTKYLDAGLLPDHTVDINSEPRKGPSLSQAYKVQFAGVKVADEAAWQRSLMRFNAALGMELQGDLHVVLVDASKVPFTDSSSYLRALKAHWQNDAVYGKRTIAKNAIILAIGVTPGASTVDWADATTGMPFGNNVMSEFIKKDMAGQPLDPELLFGKPVTNVKGDDYTMTLSTPRGVLEKVIFEDAPFKRASMTCDSSDDDCIGYEHLVEKIEPGSVAKSGIVIVTFLLAIGLWLLVGFTTFVDDLIGTVFHRGSAKPAGPNPYDMQSRRSRMTRTNGRGF